jgi:diguanylate cyclase (GGDEF)-like protein
MGPVKQGSTSLFATNDTTADEDAGSEKSWLKGERDIVALGIAFAALILFVGTGGSLFPQIARSWMGSGPAPDNALASAMLLNVALLVFGWRRHTQLASEVQERRKAEHHARMLAETDALTGLLNRRSAGPAIATMLAEAREQGDAVALMMLDLDNFKQINDLNGHKVGDEVLVKLAQRMRMVVPAEALVARLGGDEFACAVPFDPRTPDRIDQLASRIVESIERPVQLDSHRLETTVSIGITHSGADKRAMLAESDGAAADALVHHADIAMYHAKKQGRNGYAWFETPMESELRFRNELETGIRRGIGQGEFVPYYEQQIDLDTGKLVGFEMLARWNSPQLGVVSPTIFIPIAEDIGVIADLSEMLLKQAFEDAKKWDPTLTLSVNISPIQLRDPWFSQKLLKLLVESGFPAERLDIEITESCLHENIGAVRSVLTSLRNQGIRISLDDFGTGYSSLAQLRSLPFDRLKIDRSFVSELAEEDPNSKIVEAIVSLGRGLELPITAEGIENGDILEVLRKIGHLRGQGFLYGQPEDAAATEDRLQKLEGEEQPEAPGARKKRKAS